MNVITALEAMEAAAQGNARLNALKENDSPELRRILHLSMSPEITFGVKRLPVAIEPPPDGPTQFPSDEQWYGQLLPLLGKLSERKLTGNDAQYEIGCFLGYCSETQLKWSQRILKRDLRINVGAKDVNNALGEQTIYLEEPPLAAPTIDREGKWVIKPKDLQGEWFIQAKLDGGRARTVLPGAGGRVKMLSRTGKEWFNFESVRTALQAFNDTLTDLAEPLYLDGEVVSILDGKVNFQAIQKTMRRKDGTEVGELRYVVFDAADESEWKNPKEAYYKRLDRACQLVTAISHSRVELVPTMPQSVKDPTEAWLRAACDAYVELNYEGAMARRADVPVENKRSKKLLKIKTFIDDEAEIIGTTEGLGKYEGMLGTLVCRSKDGNIFEIGSGYSDAERGALWAQRAELVGAQVSFKYFELTDDGNPRFPIFRYLRAEEDIG